MAAVILAAAIAASPFTDIVAAVSKAITEIITAVSLTAVLTNSTASTFLERLTAVFTAKFTTTIVIYALVTTLTAFTLAAATLTVFNVNGLAFRVVANMASVPAFSTNVTKLVATFTCHVIAATTFLDHVFATVALTIVESVLEKVKLVRVAVSRMFFEKALSAKGSIAG